MPQLRPHFRPLGRPEPPGHGLSTVPLPDGPTPCLPPAPSSYLPALVACFASWRVGVSFLAHFFTLGNNKTKTRDFPAILRPNGLFFKIAPDISRHFQTLNWDKWAILHSFLCQNRYFARQSLNTPPIPLDISGHFCLFAPFCEILSLFLGQYGPSAFAPPTRPTGPTNYFTPQSLPPRLQASHGQARLLHARPPTRLAKKAARPIGAPAAFSSCRRGTKTRFCRIGKWGSSSNWSLYS